MKRHFTLICLLALAYTAPAQQTNDTSGETHRRIWIQTLTRIADPVLTNLAEATLKQNMPFESIGDRKQFSYLEAVGRLIGGMAPWLELGADSSEEGKLRQKYLSLTLKGLKNAVDPSSPDYLEFEKPYQPLVDAAFLAQGLLRAPTQIWQKLDKQTQQNMITALKRSRSIKPWNSNWLLFASIVEAALLEFTGHCDNERLMHGVTKFRDDWYLGDAIYGDGPVFHQDYYNSFVIHPMLTDVLVVMKKHNLEGSDFLETQLKRHARYAAQLERFISPEGTFPAVGRSIVYRTGAFHALGQAALMHNLTKEVSPAQVRCALTAVIQKVFSNKDNFDANGWLTVGFTGRQIKMSESYINTGSVYLCSMGFLALGLPATDEFWAAPFAPWTNLRAWNGEEVVADKAIK